MANNFPKTLCAQVSDIDQRNVSSAKKYEVNFAMTFDPQDSLATRNDVL